MARGSERREPAHEPAKRALAFLRSDATAQPISTVGYLAAEPMTSSMVPRKSLSQRADFILHNIAWHIEQHRGGTVMRNVELGNG